MLMSTDVASIMLPVTRGIMDRERDIDTAAAAAAAGPGGSTAAAAAAAAAAVRGMKRGDPEPDAQTAAALTDLAGAECKRPRIDGTGSVVVVGDIGQNNEPLNPGFHGYPPHSQRSGAEVKQELFKMACLRGTDSYSRQLRSQSRPEPPGSISSRRAKEKREKKEARRRRRRDSGLSGGERQTERPKGDQSSQGQGDEEERQRRRVTGKTRRFGVLEKKKKWKKGHRRREGEGEEGGGKGSERGRI
ncbi:hypothetical protein D9C73_026270 [Collichthys lucidus]|uniref:Uncharacterized protein n=1 Tax=Collichthys lucidus TaxID=240159 RepID=A0A4U5VTA8_COLLU|nr:hypothetical protein D9C73_026270 [Collichthys lucidus]